MNQTLAPVDPPLQGSSETNDPIPISMAFRNCVGQSKFPIAKQLEIQSFACTQNLDILHLSCKIDKDTFSQCGFLTSHFNIFNSNKPDNLFYGTASLIRSDLDVTYIHKDDDGRIIVFDAAGCTWANMYIPCGSGRIARENRENYFGSIIPQIMIRWLGQGAAGGDFNSIIHLQDSKKLPENTLSPSCKLLVNAFLWSDSYRILHPTVEQFSRYHSCNGEGATRIDRASQWGELKISEAAYHSISFSDHLSLKVSYLLPHKLDRHLTPQTEPSFKIHPCVVIDELFQTRLRTAMAEWTRVKESGANIITGWQYMVKGGIKFIANARSKELKKGINEATQHA